jgi:hypothetical protein
MGVGSQAAGVGVPGESSRSSVPPFCGWQAEMIPAKNIKRKATLEIDIRKTIMELF